MNSPNSDTISIIGRLLAGPMLGILIYGLLPDQYSNETGQLIDLTFAARATAAVAVWMAIWWMTEATSVYATALVPLVAFPLLGIASIKQMSSSYGHELIFLFMGGFILALALERWGLHRRFASHILSLFGTGSRTIIAAFMIVAASLSMWVTNTATTIMLLPVATSVIKMASSNNDESTGNFSVCLLLGIAYAASIGGVGTLVGTAPNIFLASFIETQMGSEISFAAWMMVGVPIVILFVPITWLCLVRILYPVSATEIPGLKEKLISFQNEQGRIQRGEKLTLIVFAMTAAGWITRPLLTKMTIMGYVPLEGLSDAGIAMTAALALFIIPVRSKERNFLMDWQTAVKLPWGVLILFGGGLSLAAALANTGLTDFLGSRAIALDGLPMFLIVGIVISIMIFLTELTSNMATTATLIPIFYAVALGLGLDPYWLIIPATIAASCAFMLPVATPPNAIVYGSGQISIPQMCRAGIVLNLIGMILITMLTYSLIIPVLSH